jgi:hypothetical protein
MVLKPTCESKHSATLPDSRGLEVRMLLVGLMQKWRYVVLRLEPFFINDLK